MSTLGDNREMEETSYLISRTPEFEEWMRNLSARIQMQIFKRLAKIEHYGHFGDHKSVSFYEKGLLKDVIWELRWDDGKRVYYAYIPKKRILLLLGGNKNGQDKDVTQAKSIFIKASRVTQKKR